MRRTHSRDSRRTAPEPYRADQETDSTLPITVIILARDEEANIGRCLRSTAWAAQRVVIDSGSTDETAIIAREQGATVISTHWRGFGAQREYALRLEQIEYDWVYFIDADEWVSGQLVEELCGIFPHPKSSAYWQCLRLIFQGQWIAHSGWYPDQRVVRLMKRSCAKYEEVVASEHPQIQGVLGHLQNDLVDEDLKGLSNWLHKHVRYAELEVERRSCRGKRERKAHQGRIRYVLKDKVAPAVPARPLLQFIYMYIVRGGFKDGRTGLSFALYHAWFQLAVKDLQREQNRRAEERDNIA